MPRQATGSKPFRRPEELTATFRVERRLYDRFRETAKRNERTVSAELRSLMRQHVEKEAA